MRDAWRLAVGTLTTVRVRAPAEVNPRTAASAMLLAPLAGVVLGAWAGAVFWTATGLGVGSLAAAALAVAALRLGDRAFHLDGLADTADGLAASYDRERALAVMRTGDTGPAGAAALVLVLLVQVAAMAELGGAGGAVGVAGCVVVSRGMLVAGCLRGVPAARREGLGAVMAGSVPRSAALAVLMMIGTAFAGALEAAGASSPGHVAPWWSAFVVTGVAVLATAVVLRRCVHRFGGITGDVLGAVVEVSLAAALVAFAAATPAP